MDTTIGTDGIESIKNNEEVNPKVSVIIKIRPRASSIDLAVNAMLL